MLVMKSATTILHILPLLFLLSLACTSLQAGQTDKKTGEPLIGTNVILEGTTLGSSTDFEGRYAILNVSPGTHTLIVSMVGYTSTRVSEVKVNIDLTTTIDVQLSETVLELGQEVVVVAERPLVRKDQTAKTAVIGKDELSALPV